MEKYYVEYGKFIIHFEKICFSLNYIIREICTDKKMFDVEDKRIEILLQGLTAQPILSKFRSIILTSEFSNDKELMRIIEAFISNFQKVIEYRNLLSHGTFFYGDPYGNVDKFQLRSTKLNKEGFYDNTNIVSIESLSSLNSAVTQLTEFIDLLLFYIKENSKNLAEMFYKKMESIISNININLKIDYKSIRY